jgi:D-psicose/D-tagatose/L-ribulose 3-epimerase
VQQYRSGHGLAFRRRAGQAGRDKIGSARGRSQPIETKGEEAMAAERPTLGVHALVWTGGWAEADATRAIENSAELGYDFIEIPLLDPWGVDAAMTARRLAAAGLGATASLGLSAETDISSEDPETVRRGSDLLHQALAVTRDMGGTHLCGVIHCAMMKYQAPATPRGRDNAVGVLSRLADAAREAGIVVGLEAVNRYESNLVNTAAQAVELTEAIGRDNVVAHLDTYHMNIEDGFVAGAIRAAGSRVGYFHVGESHRGYLGTGTIDFAAAFRALAEIGYAGPIAFESFSSAVVDPHLSNTLGVWRNLWSDSRDLAAHAKAFMEAQLVAANDTVARSMPAG